MCLNPIHIIWKAKEFKSWSYWRALDDKGIDVNPPQKTALSSVQDSWWEYAAMSLQLKWAFVEPENLYLPMSLPQSWNFYNLK